MCGRYHIDDGITKEIEKTVGWVNRKQMEHSKDVCPSQSAIVLTGRKTHLAAEEMVWGFPQYQKKGLLINARAETVLEKKTFRDSVLHRRCIIPASYFYEWDSDRNKATFRRESQHVLYMAGFYNRFQDEDRFVILTTQANVSVSPVHDRMPLLLEEGELEAWVYDDTFLEFALHKIPHQLQRSQEYEQQSLLLTSDTVNWEY